MPNSRGPLHGPPPRAFELRPLGPLPPGGKPVPSPVLTLEPFPPLEPFLPGGGPVPVPTFDTPQAITLRLLGRAFDTPQEIHTLPYQRGSDVA